MSSTSSSSYFVDLSGYNPSGVGWLSLCRSAADIGNPSVGQAIGMRYQGSFATSDANYGAAALIERGGLVKTPNGNGAVFCQDAESLFSLSCGTVSLWLNLPAPIVNGVYVPLRGDTSALRDYVLWGVNFGEAYITPPGFYAALTPSGIEFTIWTGAGRYTLLDTVSNIPANTDFKLDFVWSSEPPGFRSEAHMVLAVDDSKVVESDLLIDGRQSLAGRSLWALDTPANTSGGLKTLRRVEIYDTAKWFNIEMSSSSSYSSSSFGFSSSSTALRSTSSSNSSNSSSSPSSSTAIRSSSSTAHLLDNYPPTNYWTMDEVSGSRADIVNGVSLIEETLPALPVGSNTGVESNAAYVVYDPVDQGPELGTTTYPGGLLPSTNFVVSCWTKVTGTGARIEFAYNSGGIDNVSFNATPTSVWHHNVVMVFGTTREVYDQGALINNDVGALLNSGTLFFRFSNYNVGTALYLDEVALFKDISISTPGQRAKLAKALYNNGNGRFYRGGVWL